MNYRCLFLGITLILLVTGCYVTRPKYSTLDEVLKVQHGMHYDTVTFILQTEPYDFLTRDDSGNVSYIYKYRRVDIHTLPNSPRRNSGVEVEGRFRDLVLTFSADSLVTEIYTKPENFETSEVKKDVDVLGIVNTVTTFLSVTLPGILVYLSIK